MTAKMGFVLFCLSLSSLCLVFLGWLIQRKDINTSGIKPSYLFKQDTRQNKTVFFRLNYAYI